MAADQQDFIKKINKIYLLHNSYFLPCYVDGLFSNTHILVVGGKPLPRFDREQTKYAQCTEQNVHLTLLCEQCTLNTKQWQLYTVNYTL